MPVNIALNRLDIAWYIKEKVMDKIGTIKHIAHKT
jgi:hypothetical protein